MYESDDDPDRRRDKFARERRDDDRRSGGYSRHENQKRPPPRRDDYPPKRSRNEDDENGRHNPSDENDNSQTNNMLFAGPLLPFKRFLSTQDDDISDEDAIKKYNEYKVEHKKHQLNRFFQAHKDEEWFRLKYNPEDAKKVEESHLENTQKRLKVFNELKESGIIANCSLDYDNAEKILRALDAVVVKLEDGNDEILNAVLSQKLEDESLSDLKDKNENGENGDAKMEEPETEEEKAANKINIHKTCSVFLRNIPPDVKIADLEAVCKRSPGFLRLALTDGIPERKFYRRGWATYKRDVNIKEICWTLNSVRMNDTDMNVIINRDITRRVRTTNGISSHKQVALHDLKLAVKLTALFDKRIGLFNASNESKEEREKDIRMGVDLVSASTNPILKEIRKYVSSDSLDELSSEEAELLGMSNGDDNSADKVKFERDENVLKALDLLVIYLRIVHSVDFYNHGHYSQEDSMPNRCGLIHVRGSPPSGAQITNDEDGNIIVTNKFVQDFISGFNSRIEKALIDKEYVSEEELQKLGKKDPEQEVEAFILKNTVELDKEKWLCPVSGKKFKGPEFIRKHLQSKHEEKLDEVRFDANFFNQYLSDAQRPVDVEIRSLMSISTTREREDRGGAYGRERDDDRSYNRSSFGGYGDRSRGPPPRNSSSGGNRGRYFEDSAPPPRRDVRPQVSYRDLDAPEDIP